MIFDDIQILHKIVMIENKKNHIILMIKLIKFEG
jgi:hypothetical protein